MPLYTHPTTNTFPYRSRVQLETTLKRALHDVDIARINVALLRQMHSDLEGDMTSGLAVCDSYIKAGVRGWVERKARGEAIREEMRADNERGLRELNHDIEGIEG